MSLPKILTQLKAERRRLHTAIAALEKIIASAKEERGRMSGRSQSPSTPHQRTGKVPVKGKLLQFRLPRTRARRKPKQAEEA